MFRDRATGAIVIAQFPKFALIVWLSATALTMVTTGGVHTRSSATPPL